MKIVIASEAYYPLIDGGAVAEHNLALELHKRGHEVHIIAPSENFRDWTEPDQGTTIHRLASHPIPFVKNDHRLAWRPQKKINQILHRIKPDVVHIHNPFPIGKATLNYCGKMGIPVIATNHWLPENITTFMAKFRFLNNLNFLVRWNWKFISDFHNKCQFVTSPTQTAIDLMTENGLTAPHRPVSNGVNTTVFNPQNDPSILKNRFKFPNKPTAMYAGRLSGEKHVDVFIRAIPAILKQVDAHFIIGGNGREKPALQALAAELGVSDNVTFPGFLNDDEYKLLFRCANLFVMPSICELQSITTLEAMASGLPVVAANKYALPELVKPSRNGYLFEPGDSAALARYATEILSDPTKQSAMGDQSIEIVRPHSLENAVSDYESIYRKISKK
ncbi:glycosyltransferase family 4 protein [bacterium]|nr:glycosyltransferase family 4 protein [bacterium]